MSHRLSRSSRRLAVALAFAVCASSAAAQAGANDVVYEELQDTGTLRLSQMPCAQRVGSLRANLPGPSYMARDPRVVAREQAVGAEANLQLAMLSFRGECGLRRDEWPLRSLARRDPRGAAAVRLLTANSISPRDRAVSNIQPDDRPQLDRLPKPKNPAASAAPISRKCDRGGASRMNEVEPPPSRSIAPLDVLAYWAQANLGNEALCEGQSADPQTRAYYYDWPHVVSAWQAATGRAQTGEFARADFDDLYRRIDVAASELEQERRDQKLAEARQTQQEAAAANERARREEAAEREFNSFLSKPGNPQRIYLQAGKYERASESQRAKRLYEFIVDNFAKTQWAVSANDRLLQLRSEDSARASQASRSSPGGNYRPGGPGNAAPMPNDNLAQRQQQDTERYERARVAEFQRVEREQAAEAQRVQESQRRAWENQMQLDRERQQQIERNMR